MVDNNSQHPLKLIACNSNPDLFREISDKLNHPLVDAMIGQFSDGETRIELNESVRDGYVVILQSTCPPVNHHWMELYTIIDAVRRSGAHKIVVAMPYFGYARQDKKHKGRVPITAQMVASMLEHVGITRLVAVDLHNEAIEGFFRIPVDHLTAEHILCNQIRKDGWTEEDCVIASTDAGGVARAYEVAKMLGLPIIVSSKHRAEPGASEVVGAMGDPDGRRISIVEDMVASGGSIDKATDYLMSRGAEAVRVYATHGIFCANAVDVIADSQIEMVTVTNTIPSRPETEKCSKIVYAEGMGNLLARAIELNHTGKSLSNLVATGTSD